MTFKFNFSGDSTLTESENVHDDFQWLNSEEVIPSKQIAELDKMVIHANMFVCKDLEIGHIVVNEAIKHITGDILQYSKEKHSDLVTGKYEGGLKIWECTYDLIEYLLNNENKLQLKDARVLDLGCGAGILGIYAFIKGSVVTFQDYNTEVLEYVTIPNVLLNIEEEDKRKQEIKRCKFYSGDWASFNKKLEEKTSFDFIFTSETIYNEANYEKLIELFLTRLSENGAIYVAAKTCYFGVGGGIRQFEKAVQKCAFDCVVCWKNTDGIQREILKITRKN